MQQWQDPRRVPGIREWHDEDTTSLSAYIRQGGRAGLAAAIGLESVLAVFFIITRASLVLLGIDGLDEVFACLTLIFGAIFAGIGYAVGAVGGMIAWHMQR